MDTYLLFGMIFKLISSDQYGIPVALLHSLKIFNKGSNPTPEELVYCTHWRPSIRYQIPLHPWNYCTHKKGWNREFGKGVSKTLTALANRKTIFDHKQNHIIIYIYICWYNHSVRELPRFWLCVKTSWTAFPANGDSRPYSFCNYMGYT